MEIPKTQIEEIPKTEEMPKTQVAAETKANLQLWPSLARSLLFNKHSLLYFWQNNPKTWKWHCKAASACSWVRRRKCSGGGNVENTKIKGQIQIQRQKVQWWWSRKNTPNFLWLSCNATPAVALVNMWNKIQRKKQQKYKSTNFLQSVRCGSMQVCSTAVARCANVQNTNHSCLTSIPNLNVTSSTLKLHLIFELNECVQYSYIECLLYIAKEGMQNLVWFSSV